MANEILACLLALTACVSVAALAVIAVGPALRRWSGAGAAYAAWLLLPVAIAAASLPAAPVARQVAVLSVPLASAATVVRAPAAEAPAPVAGAILALWAASAMLAAGWQVLCYRRFVRGLGVLAGEAGVAFAESAREGPLLLGLLRPLVVLPADFQTRYTAPERELILAHERRHALRRDPLANAACALAQCVWWFNPVIHYAARRFRMDQELACDQAVMRAYPGRARTYAQAMLKTQLSDARAPFACQWQSHHPLKERILNLQRPHQSLLRRFAGRAAVTLLMAGGAWSAWAAQGAADAHGAAVAYDIAMVVTADGATSTPRMVVHAGQEATLRVGNDTTEWGVTMKLTPAGSDTVFVSSTLSANGQVVSKPGILVRLNEKGTIKVGDPDKAFTLELTVRAGPAPANT